MTVFLHRSSREAIFRRWEYLKLFHALPSGYLSINVLDAIIIGKIGFLLASAATGCYVSAYENEDRINPVWIRRILWELIWCRNSSRRSRHQICRIEPENDKLVLAKAV